jgi:putative addiction module killer protein
LKRGNVSNVAGVGESVFELKLDCGPGYRLYFGRDGDRIVILLLGGTKKRQNRDIATAKSFWLDYKSRKPGRSK